MFITELGHDSCCKNSRKRFMVRVTDTMLNGRPIPFPIYAQHVSYVFRCAKPNTNLAFSFNVTHRKIGMQNRTSFGINILFGVNYS